MSPEAQTRPTQDPETTALTPEEQAEKELEDRRQELFDELAGKEDKGRERRKKRLGKIYATCKELDLKMHYSSDDGEVAVGDTVGSVVRTEGHVDIAQWRVLGVINDDEVVMLKREGEDIHLKRQLVGDYMEYNRTVEPADNLAEPEDYPYGTSRPSQETKSNPAQSNTNTGPEKPGNPLLADEARNRIEGTLNVFKDEIKKTRLHDPAAALLPENIEHMRDAEAGFTRHVLEKLSHLKPGEPATKAHELIESVIHGRYLDEFGIDKDHPDREQYKAKLLQLSTINITEEDWNQPNIDLSDRAGVLYRLSGAQWAKHTHDTAANYYANADTQAFPVINNPENAPLVTERYGAKIGDEVVFTEKTPGGGQARITYVVVGFPEQTNNQANAPVLMDYMCEFFDANGNSLPGRTIQETREYSGDIIKNLGKDVKAYNRESNHQQPLDVESYFANNPSVTPEQKAIIRRKRIIKAAGVVAALNTIVASAYLIKENAGDLSSIVSAIDIFGWWGDGGSAGDVQPQAPSVSPELPLEPTGPEPATPNGSEGMQKAEQAPVYTESVIAERGDSLWEIATGMLKEAGVEPTVSNINDVKNALVDANATYNSGNVENGINEGQKINLTSGWSAIERMR